MRGWSCARAGGAQGWTPLGLSEPQTPSDTFSSFQLLDAEWVLAGCSLNKMHRPLFPLQPSVPMGPGNPVPAPGMMPSGAEQTQAVGLTGQGESHLCTMVLDPAGRGSSREKGQPLHRGWSSAGGWRAAGGSAWVKREISHLPCGGQRLRGGCQLPPSAGSGASARGSTACTAPADARVSNDPSTGQAAPANPLLPQNPDGGAGTGGCSGCPRATQDAQEPKSWALSVPCCTPWGQCLVQGV